MSGGRDESSVLDDLIDAAERLVELGADASGRFGEDRSLDESVLWNLAVMGEASKRLSVSIRRRSPDVPWRAMMRARDRVIHHYDGVDWDVVRVIAVEDLPSVLPRLIEIRDLVRTGADTERTGRDG